MDLFDQNAPAQPLAARIRPGTVDEVIGQLMSGKEASVYVVRCGDGGKVIQHEGLRSHALRPSSAPPK